MDLLDRFLGHDSSTTRELLDISRSLTDDQLDRPQGLDIGTIRSTLEHVVEGMELWTDLMLGQPLRWHTITRDAKPSIDALSRRFEVVALDFAELARRLQREGRLDSMFVDTGQGRRKAFGAAIAHVITHSMAHRAHLLTMLDRVGVADLPEGDVLGWERRLRGGWEAVTDKS